jgi:TolB-like protein
MVQWSVAYVALAYAVQHGVVLTSEAFGWPEAVLRVSMLLLILGLPVVMTFAWYHGERSSRHFSTAEMTIVSLLLVIGSILFYAFVQPHQEAAASVTSPQRSAAATPQSGISLAVLPFVNLSSDKDQEFFSDGMTDEITSALAKVRNLSVVGRTSAFQFKGEKKDLRAIGQALSARYLIDGSVRKAGERVRITAQLIEAGNGVQLWSENYDRELKDVFAVQEDIAQAIAASLQVPLGLKPGESLVPGRASNLDSYQDYLRAKALVRTRGAPEPAGPLTEAAKLLEQVVARDPGYAPAWALLAEAYELIPAFSPARPNGSARELRAITGELFPKAEMAAQRAIQLAPDNAEGYTALANAQSFQGRGLQAQGLYEHALSLDPANPEALHEYSLHLVEVGRLKDALPLRQRLRGVEPLVPIYNYFTALVLWLNGQDDAAIAIHKTLPPNSLFPSHLSAIYAAQGHFTEAADVLRQMPAGSFAPGIAETAERLLRTAPAKIASPQAIPRLGQLSFVFLYIGAPDRALEPNESEVEGGWFNTMASDGYAWHSSAASMRKTERFKAFARRAGLVDYWKARGWPDLCHPTTADDFECN